MSFKSLRILILLVVLVAIVHAVFSDRARIARWDAPLFVVIYPIAAGGSAVAERYVQGLQRRDFEAIAAAAAREAGRYGIPADRPFYIELADPIEHPPPAPPKHGNFLERSLWVLRLRWWIWRFDDQNRKPDITVFARYHDPANSPELFHSVGLDRMRVAVANLFATRAKAGENRVVLLHEILHTVGATDKYDPQTGLPAYPEGYAEPDRNPRHPQPAAEIMAGRIPLEPGRAIQAPDLDRIVIGPATAREIGWLSD